MIINTNKKIAAETKFVLISFGEKLDDLEVLTGTPTASEVGSSDLTLSDVGLNPADQTIRGQKILANKGVQFLVAGGTARKDYTIRLTASTDGSPSQTLIYDVRMSVL